ncbi:hypothetical protein DFP72DRAFT_844827 [Ephemerocybe angulata]|uniref:Uncharacterized protein n=1 Tax=Ephemerocybe angulata TaxID=980116 RepID=A0A8H6I714_9AGAR|nr:hypothetical protein DFP72DRAFT_844827 [Tulosesus angulatus]
MARGGKKDVQALTTKCPNCRALIGNSGLFNHLRECTELAAAPGSQRRSGRSRGSKRASGALRHDPLARFAARPRPAPSHDPLPTASESYDPLEPHPLLHRQMIIIPTPNLSTILTRTHQGDTLPDWAVHLSSTISRWIPIPEMLPWAKPGGPRSKKPRAPWHPFKSRLDFEFAELLQGANLSKSQLDSFVTIVHKILKRPDEFSFKDGRHVSETWNAAMTAHGHGSWTMWTNRSDFLFGRLDMEKWMLDILYNPELAPELRFDAERLSRHDGEKFVRFIDEPWTANRWWKIMDKLPDKGSPFAIIFYADKTKLSSMGTRKGYPRLCLLCKFASSHPQRGGVLGDAILVGWLTNCTALSGMPHVEKILETLRKWAETGLFYVDAWGIERLLFPIILIIAGDFEEQCVMAAIRGMGSVKFLAPSASYRVMSSQGLGMSILPAIYEHAVCAETAAEREDLFKSVGSANVKNVFWSFKYTDVYSALGWDRLHAYHSGLFRKHILQEFLTMIEHDRKSTVTFETHLNAMPRWRDLSHFSHVSQFREYSDGPTWNWDMWTSLVVHTEVTLRMGREEMLRFEAIRLIYVAVHPEKRWDFPKAHSQLHVWMDILEKGVTLNFNTKGFEKMHHKPKLARFTHQDIAAMIHLKQENEGRDMGEEDALPSRRNASDSHPTASAPSTASTTSTVSESEVEPEPEPLCVDPGSEVKNILLSDLVSNTIPEYSSAFSNFRMKLGRRLAHDLKLRDPVPIPAHQTVSMFKYMKVEYTSLEDSHTAADFIRVNPNFHNRPRYDCALISTGEGMHMIARVVSVFAGMVNVNRNDVQFQYALVIPLDAALRRDAQSRLNQKRCEALKFKQLRSRDPKDAILIRLDSIVRGALMVQDWGIPEQFNDQPRLLPKDEVTGLRRYFSYKNE